MSIDTARERSALSAETTTPPRLVAELERLLSGDLPPEVTRRLRSLLEHDLFHRQDGMTEAQTAALGYRRARFLASELEITARELCSDPRRLYALHEWVGPVDGVTCTVLSIHYCLALGSLVVHGRGRPELRAFIAELERMDSVGVFLATELGYGNSAASLETTAVYDAVRREFTLSSPTRESFKFMPNTGFAVPKLAVVMARLIAQGEDRGVFPFVVRIRGGDGKPCPGVRITPLSEKPGYALDNAVTQFQGVRIPKSHLLEGEDSTLHDDGRFESRLPSHRQRFLTAMDRVQTGRVCFTGASAASLRAATWICMRYTAQRLSSAPGKRRIPLLRYRNVQRDVFGALATAYAVTFAVRHLQERFRQRTPETEQEIFRLTATLKAVVTAEVSDALPRLRERCGAVGMLSANRILEYWNQLQGLITAEGDNQLMLLKAGRQLFDEPGTVPLVAPRPAASAALAHEHAVLLFRFREAHRKEELRASAGETRRVLREPLAIWNENVNRTLSLANAYGSRVLAECFGAAIDDCRDADAARALESLFALWALGQVEREAGWFLSRGSITRECVETIARERDRLCAAIEPYAHSLVNAFGIDNKLLRVPIAEDDYVAAYHAFVQAAGPVLSESGTFRIARTEPAEDRVEEDFSRPA
jgi:acyl-CoA oxidase